MNGDGGPAADYPVLVADIGGTNARFGVIAGPGQPVTAIGQLTCADFPGLVPAVEHYLGSVGAPRPRRAGLAVATPVAGDRISLTNNDWSFSVEAARRQLGLALMVVINDFTAVAMSLPYLGRGEVRQVGGGEPVAGAPLAVLGPGTGLGVSGLIPCAGGWTPLSGEGGHVTFAPASEREAAIWSLLRREYPHVSAERLVSGMGLVNLYRAIATLEGAAVESLSPAEISGRALQGISPICREALDCLCAMLGTVASNLVLTLGATGGVFIGGGIIPRLADYFAASPFRTRFEDKGRFSAYLAAVPSYVITASYPALTGVAAALGAQPINGVDA